MPNIVIHLATAIIDRIREPSSWSGIAVLLALFGLSGEESQAITQLLSAAAATASVFMREQGQRR
ncbi:MAG: hypothetical protein HQL64_05815 [Magnetococcales bacterium]|nr:hypothetical protein [Magnetococcales bacterium]